MALDDFWPPYESKQTKSDIQLFLSLNEYTKHKN